MFSYTFDLLGRVGDAKIFTQPISGNKTTFLFGLRLKKQNLRIKIKCKVKLRDFYAMSIFQY